MTTNKTTHFQVINPNGMPIDWSFKTLAGAKSGKRRMLGRKGYIVKITREIVG